MRYLYHLLVLACWGYSRLAHWEIRGEEEKRKREEERKEGKERRRDERRGEEERWRGEEEKRETLTGLQSHRSLWVILRSSWILTLVPFKNTKLHNYRSQRCTNAEPHTRTSSSQSSVLPVREAGAKYKLEGWIEVRMKAVLSPVWPVWGASSSSGSDAPGWSDCKYHKSDPHSALCNQLLNF